MGIKKIVKLFEEGNVIVTGLRRRGKDMLMSNVVARRKLPYCANIDYACNNKKCKYIPFKLEDINCGKNTYKNFISGDVLYYEYPHGGGVDVYISDAGNYFPSQYCNELNRDYPYVPTFQSLCGQLGVNFFVNIQNLNRLWDKIREQSDCYLRCEKTKVFFGKIVFMRVIQYDKYESCLNRVKPYKPPKVRFNSRDGKTMIAIEKAKFEQANGLVKGHLLLFINRSKYDTTIFKSILKNGRRV